MMTASHLPQKGYAGRALLGAMLCHLVWGCQPVLTRLLQTVPSEALNKMSVVCLTQSTSAVFAISASCCRKPSEITSSQTSRLKFYGFGILYGLLAACRAGTNFLSAGLTSSWHISMVAMLSPFTTAAMSRCLLNEFIDSRVWLSLLVATAGATLVVYAEEQHSTKSSQASASAGATVQFISILFSGSARIAMKATAGHYSSTQLMVFQYTVTVCLAFLLSLFSADTPRAAWLPWLHASTHVFLTALALSFCIQWAAAESQVILIRELSPALYTSFQPLRIISTALLGSILLHEYISGYRQWLGLFLVFIGVATFLIRRIIWPLNPQQPHKVVTAASTELVRMQPTTSPKLDKGDINPIDTTKKAPRPFPPFMSRLRNGQTTQNYTAIPVDDIHNDLDVSTMTSPPAALVSANYNNSSSFFSQQALESDEEDLL